MISSPGGILDVTLYITLALLIILFTVSVMSSLILMNYIDVTEIVMIFQDLQKSF